MHVLIPCKRATIDQPGVGKINSDVRYGEINLFVFIGSEQQVFTSGVGHDFMSTSKGNSKATIAVENINVPGKVHNVNAKKYAAMKRAFLKILPRSTPGLSQKEIQDQVKPHLPADIFPDGASSGWWAKTVQLDLEAKGVVLREPGKPLRWHKV